MLAEYENWGKWAGWLGSSQSRLSAGSKEEHYNVNSFKVTVKISVDHHVTGKISLDHHARQKNKYKNTLSTYIYLEA